MCTPWLPTRSMSACNTSTVARASSRARWVGWVATANSRAKAASRTLGASSRLSTRRASRTVHSTCGRGQAMSHRCAAARRNPTSNPALWATSTASAGELEKHRQHGVDGRGVAHHRRGDAGELHDLRRDAALRVDEGGELAEHDAAADLDRPDLGDGVARRAVGAFRASAGGLQVHHDESGFAQRDFVDRGGGRVPAWRPAFVEVGETQLSRTTRTHGRDVRHVDRQSRVPTPGGMQRRIDVGSMSVPAVSVRVTAN